MPGYGSLWYGWRTKPCVFKKRKTGKKKEGDVGRCHKGLNGNQRFRRVEGTNLNDCIHSAQIAVDSRTGDRVEDSGCHERPIKEAGMGVLGDGRRH